MPEKDEPTFRYTVTADVTDTTGETRSGSKAVNVGYIALRATVSADEWLTADKDVKFAISTTTLDGEGQAAKGTLKVSRAEAARQAGPRPDIDGGYRPRFRAGAAADEEPKPDPSKPAELGTGRGGVQHRLRHQRQRQGRREAPSCPPGIYRAIARDDRTSSARR